MLTAQLQSVEPGFLHQAALLLAGLIGGLAAAAGIYSSFFKRSPKIEPQPLEVTAAPQYATTAFCAQMHHALNERVEAQGDEIQKIWEVIREQQAGAEVAARSRSAGIYDKIEKVRTELAIAQENLRKEVSKGFNDLERAIGRLEGQLKDRP